MHNGSTQTGPNPVRSAHTNPPMRIGIDARLIYHQPTGIGKYTLNLLQAFAQLAAEGQHQSQFARETDFLMFQHRRHATPLVRQPGFRRATLYSPVHTRLEQLSLPVELLFHRIDLLHSPDFIPPLHTKLPTVITVHDLAFLHWPHFLTEDSAAYYGQIDRAVQRANHIIVPSESTKKDLIGQLGVPDDRVSVIYEAANPRFRPLPPGPVRQEMGQKYGIPSSYLLFVGTVEPRKNVDGLLQAFAHLQKKYNVADTRLVIAGSYGWLYEETVALVDKLGLGDTVQFLGRVPDADLWKLYAGARCHIHAAHYEGFGLPPLEAMACGTPTIVSNTSSLPEVVGDAALLVDPNNWEEIAVNIHRVLTDEELHTELREKGLRRAACFSWTQAAKKTLAVYQKILDPTLSSPDETADAEPDATGDRRLAGESSPVDTVASETVYSR